MPSYQTFSEYFQLDKNQFALDFVDVPINNGDIPLFIDPYAISKRDDRWSIDCHNEIVNFFQGVINKIIGEEEYEAKKMLSGLREPNQTRLGLSVGAVPRGRGVGGEQANALYSALSGSTAVTTGFINDLEECELLIEGIGKDKISDITTNIIRPHLIEYTKAQCELLGVPIESAPSGMIWDSNNEEWINEYTDLPICNRRSVILVPKAIARFDIEFNHKEYYQHFVLNYLQDEHLSANTSLVRTLKDGTKRPPFKKDISEEFPLSKENLYEFSKVHPEVLDRYKKSKDYLMHEISVEDLLVNIFHESPEEIAEDFEELLRGLDRIPVGKSAASRYHSHIVDILTAIFYPSLINPQKEREIHSGRKRIDIVFQNAARGGFFLDLPNIKKVPSAYIFTECKNYSSDPANPELDQLSGRFSANRGQFGLLVCRNITNKDLFIERCKDTVADGRGFIIPLDDTDLKELLVLRKKKEFNSISSFLEEKFQALVM